MNRFVGTILFSIFVCAAAEDSATHIDYNDIKQKILESPYGKIEVGEAGMATIWRSLGVPNIILDLNDHDDKPKRLDQSVHPLMKYEWEQDWNVFIYAVKSDYWDRIKYDSSIFDNVGSIDFLPKKRMVVELDTANFEIQRVTAACAAWIDYTDQNIVVSIYSGRPAHGDRFKGDLNRISIKPRKSIQESKAKRK